jgi:hypothetical protein
MWRHCRGIAAALYGHATKPRTGGAKRGFCGAKPQSASPNVIWNCIFDTFNRKLSKN